MLDKNLSYKITDSTLISISSIERNLAILNQNELSAKAKYRIINESLFDELFAVNNFLDLKITLGEVKKLSIGNDIDNENARLLMNVRQVFDFITHNYRNKDQIVFNFQFVQHVVKLLQSGLLEEWEVGKIRSGQESLFRTFELESQLYEQEDTANLLADAIIWVENENSVHPMIKAIIFMMLINNLSPFVGLNFVSSLMFFRLILEKYNYGNNLTVPLFKILNDVDDEFRQKLNGALALTPDNSIGLTDLIEFITQKLEKLILTYKEQLMRFDYVDIKNSVDKLDLNERQIKLLKLLQDKVYIKRREYIKLFKVAPMTAYRDLNYLAEKKLVVIGGQGKSTKYTLSTLA